MKKYFVYIGICMGFVLLTGLFLTLGNGGKLDKSVAAKVKDEAESKEVENKKNDNKKAKKESGGDEKDKSIREEARKELSELKRKKLIKNTKTLSKKSKKKDKQKKEKEILNKAKKQGKKQDKKTKDEETDWKTKALGGMFDEEKMMEEEGKPVNKPKYTVENIEKNTEVIVQSNGKCQISIADTKEKRKKTNKTNKTNKKNKKKKRRLTFDDLVMTDEEEAAYWGYTLEEWNNLSDKEKFGTVEGSKANTPFGGPSIGFDFY